MRTRTVVALLAIGLVPSPSARPQAAPPPSAATAPHFTTGAEAVALDLVVRDKKGKLVLDLQQGEIEVLEDGVVQKLTSFRRVESAGAPAAAPGATLPAAAPAAARHAVLVFGRLGANGRRLAQDAGEEFARKQVGLQTPTTVVRVDGGLIPVLDRSTDPVAVKEGVRKATGAVAGAQGIASNTAGTDSSYSGQQVGRLSGGASSRDLSQSESLAFLGSLVSVVDALVNDPGRKSVLVFSEGFAVPVGYEHVFADLKSRANRANVSFYCLDVRGLQLQSQLGASGSALASATALSESQRQAGNEAPVTRDQMTQDDVLQASLRADVVDTLAELATSTGGFLVTQTNDFGRPLARIGEDLHGYYEVSYTPSSPAGPGQFRKIEVRLARKEARVQARSGYYTTPPAPAASSPAVAFAAFSKQDLPGDIALHRAFYRFGREKKGAPFDCLLKVEASLEKAEFRPGAPGRLAGKIAFAGRVLGATGDVVETFGQDIALGGTEEQIRDARSRTLPLARRLKLAPGNYTIELIVRDAVGDKATAERFPVTVPETEGSLSMTSLVVVSAVEPADPKSDPTDPLRLGDKRILPNLGQPVAPSAGASLPIYYVVFVKPGSKLAPKATVEVARGTQVVARGSSPLAAADEGGRITGLSPIPLQKLTPGSYTVKVSVTDGETTAEETTTVTIGS